MTRPFVFRAVSVALIVASTLACVPAARAEVPPKASVTVGSSGVSIDAQAVPLRDVLLAIARVTGIAVYIEDTVERAVTMAPTTMTFERVSLEEALSRVLRGCNFILEYSGRHVDAVRLFGNGRGAFARVDPGGDGRDRTRGGQDERDAATLAEIAVSAPDPDDRSSALTDLAAVADDGRVRDVAAAVLDRERNEDVLDTVLGVLGGQSSVPVDALLRFAARDAPAPLRIQALELLTEHARDDPRVRGALATLASDRDESVRETAQSMLEDLTE